MKKTNMIIKDTFREIKKTKGRFFSIFAIVMIGVSFFAGIMSSGPTMRKSADHYFDEYNLMDYRILSNFGLTTDDINAIRNIDGVESVSPGYEKDVLVTVNNKETVLRVHSLDMTHSQNNDNNYINQAIVLEGRLPNKHGECIVEQSKISENGINIGDSLVFKSGKDDEQISDYFTTDTYKVVGIMHTPYYLSQEKGTSDIGGGSVQYYAFIPAYDFDMEVFTEAFVTIKNAKAFNSYDDAYFDYLEPFTNELEALGIERSDIRRQEILDEANAAYEEGLKAYEEGKAEYEDKIKKAQEEIEQGKLDLLEGKMTLQSKKDMAQMQFDSAQAQLEQTETLITTLEEEYQKMYAEYETANKETIEKKDEVAKELETAKKEQQVAKEEYDKAKEAYDNIKAVNDEYDSLKNEYNTLTANNTTLSIAIESNKAMIETNNLLISQIDEKLADTSLTQEEIDAYNDRKNSLIASNQEYENENISNNDKIIENENKIASNKQRIEQIENDNPNLSSDYLNAQTEFQSKEIAYNTATRKVETLQTTYDSLYKSLDLASNAVDQIKEKIDEYKKQVEDGKIELANQKQIANEEFAKAEREIANATTKLANGTIELEKAKKQGQEELDDAYDELVKASDEIDRIEEAKWYVLDRTMHYSYVDYQGACERIEAIAKVFPVFFYLVAALVCLTTMTRMVDEQRNQIGTLKALGYTTNQIAFKYVFYAGFASFMGSIAGLAFGIFLYPAIIYTAWNMMYLLPTHIEFAYEWNLMFLATIISMLVTTLAALFACYNELIETPSLLMRPKAPKIGKKILLERINIIWKHLSFTSKVTARNIFRYKKRFIMTVVGISGCTALLIAGFGIKDSINTIIDKQFGEVFFYEGVATLNDNVDMETKENIVNEIIATDEIDDALLTYRTNGVVSFNDENEDVTICVIDDIDRFKDFVSLHERESGNNIDLNSSGVVISERMANAMNIKAGDTIKLENIDKMVREVEVSAICENYVDHYVYMTSGAYKNTYDVRAVNNSILIKINDNYSEDDSASAAVLSKYSQIQTVSFFTSIINSFSSMIASLNYIVIVLVIAAGALAFVVLYNLTNVNISERTREIATLMVLGFNDKEVNEYVYKENLILTFVGSIAGLFLGKILHLTIMVVVELDYIMFGRNIEPISYVISVIITMIFAVIVNQVMKKKLRSIPMVESLKSVE